LEEVVDILERERFVRVPVTERGKLVGIIVTAQIARAGNERKVGETLLAILGRPVSATTVSRVAKSLDTRDPRRTEGDRA